MSHDTQRESPAIRAGVTAASVAGFVVFVAVSIAGLRPFYESLAGDSRFVPPRGFAAPQLVTGYDGAQDTGIAAQRRALDAYRWVDRPSGVVQIPIARAMEIVAARGTKAYDPAPAKASP